MFKTDEEFSGYPFPEEEFYFNYGEEISVYPIPRFAYENLNRSPAKGLTAYRWDYSRELY
jgi:hypothetical protein